VNRGLNDLPARALRRAVADHLLPAGRHVPRGARGRPENHLPPGRL